jgi:High potential iron-sulfur protein/TAT (twin-arginine translocation) pathway signal sequence
MNRRDFMKISGTAAGLALIPVCNLSVAAEPVKLTPADPVAKAMGYVEQSTVAGSNCANCVQAGGDPKALTCKIFPGKQVSATGWCKVWAKRP